VPHQQRPNMLLLIPSRHTTLSTLIFCLIRSQKANSYLFLSFCLDPNSLINDNNWVELFGEVRDICTEKYGLVSSLRVYYNDLEVEFGVTSRAWTRVPLDDGTRQVISDGTRILYDPKSLLRKATDAVAV